MTYRIKRVGTKVVYDTTIQIIECDYCKKEIERKPKEEVIFARYKKGEIGIRGRFQWGGEPGPNTDRTIGKQFHLKCWYKLMEAIL